MTESMSEQQLQLSHSKRMKKLLDLLSAQSATSGLLLSSSSRKVRSGDQDYPFHQNRDFLYLTGCEDEGLVLLVHPSQSKSKKTTFQVTLLAQPTDKNRVLWEGRSSNVQGIAKSIGAELVVTKDFDAEVRTRLKHTERLFISNERDSRAWAMAQRLMSIPSHLRKQVPQQFHLADELLTPLRVRKDAAELRLIEEAAAITNSALFDTVPLLATGVSETFVAAGLDFFFQTRGATPGFQTIVASGRNAATLHHRPSAKKNLRNGELLLIDCGACLHGYSADITRTLPLSGSFTPIQRVIYNGVLRAQTAAFHSIRAGSLVRSVFLAAAEELTETLKEIKVLRGKTSALVKSRAFAPYFPHGIGHTLGLDVHDVGNLRGNEDAVFQEGMIFTVEPGLYFPKPIGKVPALGIRIEDDVLVTKQGCEIITEGFPKEIDEVEALMAPS